ncbi:MAG: nucleotidyltransferase domain-containing protein [Campylobacterota bacterium]|nr:nucleotidyltransferase domain-containing protein [Campylobacterota bacterium]
MYLSFSITIKSYLKENYHITKIGLFGSFARDEASKNSDVDILIEIDDKIKNIHDTKNSLKEFLSQALECKNL